MICHNRDELFARPTTSTKWWHDDDDGFEILAPRDVVSGGTWFGFEKTTGRCAFLTNIREIDSTKYSSSRGELIVNYLKSDKSLSALDYLNREFSESSSPSPSPPKEYGGFNLIVFSGHDLAYFSNRYPDDQPQKGPVALSMGKAYGISNSVLQEPYSKVRRGLEVFERILARTEAAGNSESAHTADNDNDNDVDDDDSNDLMGGLEKLMQRTEYCPGDPLPRTGEAGFSEAIVKQRSSICVPCADDYGTRTTIVFCLNRVRGIGKDHQRLLKCFEKNLNPSTLKWETSVDLDCSISLQ